MTKKALVEYFALRLAKTKGEDICQEGRDYACAVLGQRVFKNTKGAFFSMVNDIKRKADDKLSQEIDDKPRQFIKGIAEVCEDVIKRTKAWEGCA